MSDDTQKLEILAGLYELAISRLFERVPGGGFGFFQAPNLRAIMMSAPPTRSGGASGIVATSRLLGQTMGATLVAACFANAECHRPALALGLGGAFADLASVVSFLRLAVRHEGAPDPG